MSRQSTNFNEIWNIQTDMNVSTTKWDSIFHNWENPQECSQRKKLTGCVMCDHIEKYGWAISHTGKFKSYLVLIVGTVYGELNKLRELIKQYPKVSHIICTGDLGLYSTVQNAQKDSKIMEQNRNPVLKYTAMYEKNELEKFSKPIYIIPGDRDDFNLFEQRDKLSKLNIFPLDSGSILTWNSRKIGIIGGIFSSIRSEEDEKVTNQKYFNQYHLNKFRSHSIDMLITHQARRGILPTNKIKRDEGASDLNIAYKSLKPSGLYIHSHHHINYKNENTIGLGNFSKNQLSFSLINLANMRKM